MARRSRLEARIRAREFTQESLAHHLGMARNTVGRWVRGENDPEPWNRRPLADALGVEVDELDELLRLDPDEDPDRGWTTVTAPSLDDIEALELIRRVEASDTGPATLEALARAKDRLSRAYTSTPPAELLVPLRGYRAYVLRLLEGRAKLTERRELIILAGWLSLLTAICDVDVKRHRAAGANLDAARSMAHEADHSLLAAWVLETEGWQTLTAGRPDLTVILCDAALDDVTVGTSVHVQVTMQAARASARLGEAKQTHRYLEASATSLDRMSPPEHPEHHFTFDRRKHVSYTATTLAWLGENDELAEEYARAAVAQYDTASGDGRWRSRLASARLDLALVLARTGQDTEAADHGALALDSGRLRDSNLWRAVELDRHLARSRAPEVGDFHERILALPAGG